MSDLVGNPEDRFSRVAAQMRMHYQCNSVTNEPSHEKKNNLSFRLGPTQNGLYGHRSRLEP